MELAAYYAGAQWTKPLKPSWSKWMTVLETVSLHINTVRRSESGIAAAGAWGLPWSSVADGLLKNLLVGLANRGIGRGRKIGLKRDGLSR